MAAKKKNSAELLPQEDPHAPLDGAVLLKAAKPVLAELEKDLLRRADDSPGVTATLKERHAGEKKAERTADNFATWRRAFVEQVAAAWFLGVVFVRTLEDRGLIERNRIAGPGALDSQKSFFALAPSLSERDYLLTVFKELSHLPAAADLFDEKHNPVWLLAPSAEAAQKLLALIRSGSDEHPAFRFGGDTRFLGDLYQDLSENVRKRYALLQTPRFVESYILDKTLDPAIEKFGLDQATLIDPTCGSGHFLLGAFERLLDRRLAAEPGVDVRQAAKKALDAVAGTDINPYAISIARFRLTLAFLERANFSKLKDAPKLPLHLAVADSLLHNPQKGLEQKSQGEKGKTSDMFAQVSLGEQPGVDRTEWEGEIFRLEDPAATADVLGTVEKPKRYAAVVGNPPYITVKDAVLRDRYRAMYSTAFREYSLAVPFKERFFQLGRDSAFVGMITANSFMKREFGKKVIQEYLPTANLTSIVNTSGAYIPGHGTPTVLLFGTSERPVRSTVHTILASRGEPSTPEDPEQGLVWRSIADHGDEVGYENDYITVTKIDRATLSQHPWSLSGGGATELKALLEQRAATMLGDVVDSIGFMCITKQDDVFPAPIGAMERHGVEQAWLRSFVIGEHVRDWSIDSDLNVLYPYEGQAELRNLAEGAPNAFRYFWPYKTVLEARAVFGGKTFRQAGRPWYSYGQIPADRQSGLVITFAFVATHNHFVLDGGGKVFNRSAPIIKLPESATEDDHYALLAYLNSSTACFWMKQVFQPKHSAEHKTHPEPERNRFEFAGTGMEQLPIPKGVRGNSVLIDYAKRITNLAQARSELVKYTTTLDWARWDALREEEVALQEAIDWRIYELFAFSKETSSSVPEGAKIPRGSRACELIEPRRSFVRRRDHLVPLSEAEAPPVGETAGELVEVQARRRAAIESDKSIRLIEKPLFKRQWRDTDDNIDEFTFRKQLEERLDSGAHLAQAEEHCRGSTVPVPLASASKTQAKEQADDSVPYLAALRFSESGLEKFAAWQETWEVQRQEDAGEAVGEIPVPPQYSQGSRGQTNDFRSPTFWRLRGKLDVPKERFISYPGCESDEDGEPVYGWAGWDHRQRAQALGALYASRKDEEGWSKERLQPMLAGILELLPWLEQWHNEPDEAFDGAIPAVQFREFLDAECAEHGFTYDDLRAWRPPEKRAAKKVKKKAAEKSVAKKTAEKSTEGPEPS